MKQTERIKKLYKRLKKELGLKEYDFHFHNNTILIITKKEEGGKSEFNR